MRMTLFFFVALVLAVAAKARERRRSQAHRARDAVRRARCLRDRRLWSEALPGREHVSNRSRPLASTVDLSTSETPT